MKKLLALALAFLLLFAVLTACQKKPNNPDDTGKQTQGSGSEPDTNAETEFPKPNLPDRTFEGYELRIYGWDIEGWHTYNDLSSDGSESDTISDAVYRRNSAIEGQYDCVIVPTLDYYETYYNNVLTNTAAGDDYADVTLSMGLSAGLLFMSGAFCNLNNVEYFNYDAPWWDHNSVNSLSINGYLPFACSAVTLNDKAGAFVTFYNLDLADDLGITENMYQTVRSGDWTFEKLITLGELAIHDLDGDMKVDNVVTDRFGISANQTIITSLFAGGGNNYVTIDKVTGAPSPSFNTERTVNTLTYALEKIVFREDLFANFGIYSGDMLGTFRDDRSLFLITILAYGENLRDMKSEYAILPIPKYDAEQKEYHCMEDMFTPYLTSIPFTSPAENVERTSIIWEALAAKSYEIVYPEFYDVVLDQKIARDDDSKAMLNIIFGSIVFDPGHMYNLGRLSDLLTGLDGHSPEIMKSSNIASFYATYGPIFETTLESYSELATQFAEREE